VVLRVLTATAGGTGRASARSGTVGTESTREGGPTWKLETRRSNASLYTCSRSTSGGPCQLWLADQASLSYSMVPYCAGVRAASHAAQHAAYDMQHRLHSTVQQVWPRPASGAVAIGAAMPCLAMPFLAVPCLAMPFLAVPCLAVPCLAGASHARSTGDSLLQYSQCRCD
jgi:hypothetical protein